jgi:hypothetical protein
MGEELVCLCPYRIRVTCLFRSGHTACGDTNLGVDTRHAYRCIHKAAMASGVLTASTWGRLAEEDTLLAPQLQTIDMDESYMQHSTAAVLMHAFGIRKQHCSLVVCWMV